MIRNGLRVRAKPSSSSDAQADASLIDADLVRQLAELVSETDLAEIEIEKGDLRIRLTRHHRSKTTAVAPMMAHVAAPAAIAPALAAAPVVEEAPAEIDPASLLKSPMVGTVYRRANPESKPFVDVGASVKAGDRVLLVEAMKTFNDIVAHKSGTISAILVEDGQPVEYGEPLIVIA
ncbi:acetyl-CoA carboxylase biotin carboxyl carrier protein [Lichenihabitans sp. Uapishka_5]|uniref:acetyl-CoA carboxylase biotin carboxyl carrier protein n=1 Tax=Lichenihabitans sp. Uapishka_5 TaxID=3037302 RepID=UPI0029E7EDD9|nr:acetyl-CoA carboxylase biotin carboxyl carrier protein [Lichenihabitans sp. Uapishka_5]MDX7950172.1 acetyl-CoA carboxylase biotin carboxyl carrier protein [Lichenihabitans sp. Uapishka_5]